MARYRAHTTVLKPAVLAGTTSWFEGSARALMINGQPRGA